MLLISFCFTFPPILLDVPEEEETFENLPLRRILTTTRRFGFSKGTYQSLRCLKAEIGVRTDNDTVVCLLKSHHKVG